MNKRTLLKFFTLFSFNLIYGKSLKPDNVISKFIEEQTASNFKPVRKKISMLDVPVNKNYIDSPTLLKRVNNFALNQKFKNDQRTKKLHLINVHTGEIFNEVFKINGRYNKVALQKFNYFMRDFRTGEIKNINPHLLDILYELKMVTNHRTPFYVLSGYRSKKTNEMLRRRSKEVAKNSLHIKGFAIDITSREKPIHYLAQKARKLMLGGVGEYKKHNFVHLDTGHVRHWFG